MYAEGVIDRSASIAAFSQEATGEVALCPNCFDPTIPGRDFCDTCMAPVGTYAAWKPYERIWAGAWVCWKATWTVGIRPWHVRLAWLVLVLAALQVAAAIHFHWPGVSYVPKGWGWLRGPLLAVSALVPLCATALAWRTILNGRRVATGDHPGQWPDVFEDDGEWPFGPWDEGAGS